MVGELGKHGRERLKMLYIIARSLNGNMEKLEARMDGEGYDTVAGSEMWFREQSNWRTGIRGDRVYIFERKEKSW